MPMDFDDDDEDAIQDQYGDEPDHDQMRDRHLVENYSEEDQDEEYADDGDDYVPGIHDMADDLPNNQHPEAEEEDDEANSQPQPRNLSIRNKSASHNGSGAD